MTKKQTLDERPFDLKDGDLYLIQYIDDNGRESFHHGTEDGKPIHGTHINNAKLYVSYDTATKNIANYQDITGSIRQVKEFLSPRYVVKVTPALNENTLPDIDAYIDWYSEGDKHQCSYLNYDHAQDALNTAKKELVELMYERIMKIRHVQLPDRLYEETPSA